MGGNPERVGGQERPLHGDAWFDHHSGTTPSDFASGEARWLGVQPQGQEEQPRVLLMSVPYALKAGDAETLGGLPASAFVAVSPAGGTAPALAQTSPR